MSPFASSTYRHDARYDVAPLELDGVAEDQVVGGAAVDRVVADAADQDVLAAVAVDGVVAAADLGRGEVARVHPARVEDRRAARVALSVDHVAATAEAELREQRVAGSPDRSCTARSRGRRG